MTLTSIMTVLKYHIIIPNLWISLLVCMWLYSAIQIVGLFTYLLTNWFLGLFIWFVYAVVVRPINKQIGFAFHQKGSMTINAPNSFSDQAPEGCSSCASLSGLVLCFIASFILLVIAPLWSLIYGHAIQLVLNDESATASVACSTLLHRLVSSISQWIFYSSRATFLTPLKSSDMLALYK